MQVLCVCVCVCVCVRVGARAHALHCKKLSERCTPASQTHMHSAMVQFSTCLTGVRLIHHKVQSAFSFACLCTHTPYSEDK